MIRVDDGKALQMLFWSWMHVSRFSGASSLSHGGWKCVQWDGDRCENPLDSDYMGYFLWGDSWWLDFCLPTPRLEPMTFLFQRSCTRGYQGYRMRPANFGDHAKTGALHGNHPGNDGVHCIAREPGSGDPSIRVHVRDRSKPFCHCRSAGPLPGHTVSLLLVQSPQR